MEIQILLNPNLQNYGELQAELGGEIAALQRPGVTITTKTAPPPEGTLGFGEVIQFIIDHHKEIVALTPLVTATVQAIGAVLNRAHITSPKPARKPVITSKGKRKKAKTKPQKLEALVVVIVGENRLDFPCSVKQADNFVKRVRKQGTSKSSTSDQQGSKK